MLLTLALILIVGMMLGWLCKKCRLPGLIGMMLTGIILGPCCFNLLDGSILNVSAEIRKIALIIILTRAGLSLDVSGLRKIGRPAVMMCFLPATFEIAGIILIAPALLGLSILESALLGSVLAAVSPAVVVPRMVKLIDEGYGEKKGIPQLILAGASVDDIYVIVLFTTFSGMIQGNNFSVMSFVNIPFSVAAGIALGLITGWILARFVTRFHLRDTSKVLMILSVSFLLVAAESLLKTPLSFSALIAVMFIGVSLQKYRPDVAERISVKYNKLWVGAEIFLFVLVGATVNIGYLGNIGIPAVLTVFGALVFRMAGVFVSVMGTDFNFREKLFSMLAYVPKATVQAAIGGIPLALGFSCGNITLTVAVLAIVLTAPLGAFAIDLTYRHFLSKDR